MKENRLHGLDHLRAIAILLVWLYHYRAFNHPGWLDIVGVYGWTGVDLFFVLSGFLISSHLFKEIKLHDTIRLKSFFIKRFFRIIPPFAFTVAIYFCFPFFREKEALPSLWKFITFTQNYNLDNLHAGTFSHAWSLCIEEQFYLLLPFTLLLFMKTRLLHQLKYILLALILASILLRFLSWNHFVVPALQSDDVWRIWYMHIYYPTHTRLDGLAIGVLIGFLHEYSATFKKFMHANGVLFFITGIIMLALSFWVSSPFSGTSSVFGFTLVAVAYGLLVIAAISKSFLLSRLSFSWTRQLADLSFAVYLSHKGIIHMIQSALKHTAVPENLLMIACFIGCLIAGLFYRYAIEHPFRNIKNKLLKYQKS
ncbi:acyltransferase family protein [Mucilaginibacter sp. KACC 22063]|uniref:acyltransferase family protein n=1 Tax=Mucilaginibacter sp. KACC 22063 TaxID=3025666 RepID=UPI00236573B3|nr:acyltransferase [Mucilaginibacter sp. KACC 22063]WDF57329.1 acyltransferase [Mucilaginibacter sp. KACC 22063]